MRPGRWPLTRARRAQYDLTWFVNPNNLPYFEVVALEHGYIRGEVNATHFHIQARPCGGAVGAQRAAARCPLSRPCRAPPWTLWAEAARPLSDLLWKGVNRQ